MYKFFTNDITQNGEPYSWFAHIQNRFSNKQKVWISCDAVKNIDFIIKLESPIDRLFKWLRISHEMQLGDKRLDNLIYFATDDIEVFNTIKNSPEIQQDIVEIISICKDIKLDIISLQQGKIGVILKQKISFSVTEIAEKLVPLLHKISNQFKERMPNATLCEGAVVKKISKIMKLLRYILIFASLPMVFEFFFDDSNQLLSLKPLFKDAVLSGSILTALLMIFAINFLVGSSRAHLMLKSLAMVGIIIFSIDSLIILRNANIYFDKSESSFIDTKIYKKYYGKKYNVRKIHSKNEQYDSDIFVSEALWKKAKIDDDFCIEKKSGLLGYEWTSNYRLGTCKSDYL